MVIFGFIGTFFIPKRVLFSKSHRKYLILATCMGVLLYILLIFLLMTKIVYIAAISTALLGIFLLPAMPIMQDLS